MKFEFIMFDTGVEKIAFEANDIIAMVKNNDTKAIAEFKTLISAFVGGNYCDSFCVMDEDLLRLSNESYANKKMSFRADPSGGYLYCVHYDDLTKQFKARNALDYI